MFENLLSVGRDSSAKTECEVIPNNKPNLTSSLLERKKHLESQLEEINTVIQALEKNPEITKILNLVSRVTRY